MKSKTNKPSGGKLPIRTVQIRVAETLKKKIKARAALSGELNLEQMTNLVVEKGLQAIAK